MTNDNHIDLQSRMQAVLADPGFQHELAQIRSKATLQAIGELQRRPHWTYVANRFSRNSAAALYALEAATLADPDYAVKNEKRSRQLALAWESLAKLAEGVTRPVALLNAALAYELAGYQANASYLAKEILSQSQPESRTDTQFLVASFIQRRVTVTAQSAARFLQNPPDPRLPLDILSLELGEVVLADGLSKACRYFLSGSQSAYNEAVKLLSEATKIFSELGAPLHSNIAYGIQSVLPLMMRRSTWSQLERHSRESEVWRRYLTLLARPRSSGVTELWPSQIKVLESKFLDSDNSAVVRLPTSGGKTRIAEMAILDTLQRYPEAKCVFVAPYRALASEVERSMGSILNDLGYRVSSAIGSYESDEFEEFLLRTADLLILTPEKLDLILRLRPEIFDQIKLVVLDEVHIMDDATRGVKFELLLSRMKNRLPTSRFLVMSAVVPDSTLKDFAAWLAGSPDRSITSDWRPTIQRRARFEWSGGRSGTTGVILFERDLEMPDLNAFIPGALQRRKYSFVNPDTQRRWVRQYPKPEKGDTAAELAYVFSERGPVLVFCTQPNWVESVCRAILKKSIQYRRLIEDPIHPHFDSSVQTRSLELAKEWLGEEHIATQALSQGIAPHHGRLPNVVREAIEVDCRAGRYKVIVATNTLAQGVNLPVRTVIIHSVWRTDAEGQQSRITVRDYWNIAGRAGRAGQETEGLIVHITLNARDRRDFNYYSNLGNLEPVSGALYQLLQQIIFSRLSDESIENAAAALDPEILAIAVEEEVEAANTYEWITSLEETYVAQQAIDIDPLVKSARLAAEKVFARAPEASWRRVYAQTGLSSSSCKTLSRFANTHADTLRVLLINAGFNDREELNRLVLDASLPLPEAQTVTTFAGDPEVLLGLWLEGMSINKIVELTSDGSDSVEDISGYIEELFGYRLPWIISALFRISKEALDIQEEEPSEYIRCYPAMVKHGLPDPVASWAMSAGITSRSVACSLAEGFAKQASGASSHEDFVTWLSSLSDDSLRHDYSVTGYVLDDLKYKLGRMAINPLLKPIKPIHEVLPLQEKVVGVFYENRWIAARSVRAGDRLVLHRDHDNPVDPNAVAVHHTAGQIGFLPRSLAQRLAPEIDSGSVIVATAMKTAQKDKSAISVELSLG